ncbi:uncharacterized protein ATNIH1004_002743 [Aspergillus tanneri]|nr:uncharacterized protein ATNIH1004_002743 [Aspergillus tanneri]KAA8650062.1 hypothetical protein ATNIH1004_002743 [Aspergillus tanneri]
MSKTLHTALNTSIILVEQFLLTLAAPCADQASKELSGKDVLPLLSASSTSLKAQVTKLSLLAINSPFTHSAIATVVSDLNKSVLPSLVTAALLVTPVYHTKSFQAEVLVLVNSALRELDLLLKEIQAVASKVDEAKLAQKGDNELSQSEKNVVTLAAGRTWEACDMLTDLAAKGVVGFVIRRVEEWRDLVRDAVDEIEEWDPEEEGDDFFDELLSDDGKQNAGMSESKPSETDENSEDSDALHEHKRNAIRILKPVTQIFPAIIMNRLKKVPKLSPFIVKQLELLMSNLRHIPDNVDEVAGALYEANLSKTNQYLEKTKDNAINAIKSVASPWDSANLVDSEQQTDDKFAIWSKTWLNVMREVSKSAVDDDGNIEK